MTAEFHNGQEAAFRRLVRDVVKRSHLTKSEQAVCLSVMNLWFHHRNGATKTIHPGREKLAKSANVSVRTVATTLAKMREAGVLVAVAHPRGEGQKPTEYKVKLSLIFDFCGADIPEWMGGNLAPVSDKVACKIAHHSNAVLHTTGVQELHTDKGYVPTIPSQGLKLVGGRAYA